MNTFQQILDKTKGIQYANQDVIDSVKPHKPQKVEFFTLGKCVSDDELEREYQQRGLEPVNPYALILYSLEHGAVIDEKKYVGTHWKDKDGRWCYVTFYRWNGERNVYVDRYDFVWRDYWWFAGVPASIKKELGTSDALPLNKSLDTLEISLDTIMVNGKKYKLIEE